MEKLFEEVLVQFYVDQYRENAKRSTGKPVKLAHYIHRLNNKAKSIKYARFSKNETVALDKLHQEIKRLALITYYSNNKNARQILNREILPQLVRVDMEQFDEKEAEYLTEDFLKLLRKEYIGAISYSLSQSSISTVDAVILLSDTSRHSWPVSMVHGIPASFIFSYTSSARSLRGPR